MKGEGKILNLDENRVAVSLEEAAQMLGCCKRTIERERDSGHLRCFRLGRHWKVRVSELHSYIARLEQKSKT